MIWLSWLASRRWAGIRTQKIKRHCQTGTEQKGQHKGDNEGKLVSDQHEGKKSASRGDITVGEIQNSGRTIYQRQPQGNQGIYAAG